MGLEAKLISSVPKVIKAIDKAQKKRVFEAVTFVRKEVVKKLSGTRSGRTYNVPGTKRRYVASRPGEAPARPTGDLAKSYKTRLRTVRLALEGIIGSPLKKAPMLEFGTTTMGPRPHLKVTITKNMAKIKRILTRKWF